MRIDYALIGKRIKQKRKALGLTQEKLAETLSVSVGYISQVERGITKISLDLLGTISDTLHCDVAELVTDSSLKSQNYLSNELCESIVALSERDRQLILGMISLMNEKKQ